MGAKVSTRNARISPQQGQASGHRTCAGTVRSRQTKSVPGPVILHVDVTTWSSFWKGIASVDPDAPHMDDVQQVEGADVRRQVLEYIQQAQATAQRLPRNTPDAKLQRACLKPLVRFGGRMLEDVSDGIKDYQQVEKTPEGNWDFVADPVGGKFRESTFVSLDQDSPRADFALRRCCDVEIDDDMAFKVVANYPTWSRLRPPPVFGPTAPSWRVIPWEIIAFFELKGLAVKLNGDHVAQVCYYCDNLLRITPGRRCAFGVLTNLRECKFVAACLVNNVSEWFESETITGLAAVASELAHFLTTSENLLYGKFRFPTELMTPIYALGCGSTGAVLKVKTPTDQELVVKVSANPAALEVERIVLQHLNNHDPNLIVPVNPKDLQCELGDQIKECTPSAAVCCNIYDREFADVDKALITADNLCALWDSLAAIHALGVVHCDLRTPNVKYDSNRNAFVLIDFGSSRGYDTAACNVELPTGVPPLQLRAEILQPGAMITASPAVLRSMTQNERTFECYPADEAVSMILLTLQFLFPNANGIHTPPASAQTVVIRRHHFFLSLAEKYFAEDLNNDLAIIIQQLEERRLTMSPQEMTGQVHAAIRLLWAAVLGNQPPAPAVQRQL